MSKEIEDFAFFARCFCILLSFLMRCLLPRANATYLEAGFYGAITASSSSMGTAKTQFASQFARHFGMLCSVEWRGGHACVLRGNVRLCISFAWF